MKDIFRIAIDGPSGAGKSTIAQAVAKALDIDYIDTGAMYRAIGYKIDKEGVPFEEGDALAALLDSTDIDFVSGDIILDGVVVNDLIRTPEVSMLASKCAALPSVRAKLVEIQRGMGQRKSVIMDGRDIGTNVLKDAEYKIFLTASAEERAQRRFKELQEKGESAEFQSVLESILERDRLDESRAVGPLKPAPDAIFVHTDDLNVEQVVEKIKSLIKND